MSFRWLIRAGMFTRCALLTLKSASRIARMMKISGCKPTASVGTPDVLTLLSTPTPKTTAAFNDLTLPRILTADVGVKTPSPKDVRTTRFDVPVLATFVRLLATSGRLVDVDIFLIKNTNLLKTKIYCQFFVEKRFELRLEVCDMIRRVGFFPSRLFLLSPHQPQPQPFVSPAPCGMRTPTQTAARHPLGLLRVGWFGSIFFTPLFPRVGDVGLSKCKGKLNTIKKINKIVNLPLLLLGRAWAKAARGVKKILADFLFCADGYSLAKVSASRRVRAFAMAGRREGQKM